MSAFAPTAISSMRTWLPAGRSSARFPPRSEARRNTTWPTATSRSPISSCFDRLVANRASSGSRSNAIMLEPAPARPVSQRGIPDSERYGSPGAARSAQPVAGCRFRCFPGGCEDPRPRPSRRGSQVCGCCSRPARLRERGHGRRSRHDGKGIRSRARLPFEATGRNIGRFACLLSKA